MRSPKEVVAAGWAAYLRRDLDACMGHYAEDAELALPGMEPLKGREAIRQAWGGFMAAFPEEHATLRSVAEGNVVVTEWTSTAVNTGPLPLPTGELMPATGKTIIISGVDIAEVVEGKVKRHAFYWDNVPFLTQLGILPAPEAATAG